MVWNKSIVIVRDVRGRKGQARSDVFVHVYEAEDRAPTFILVVWANEQRADLAAPKGWTCYAGELAPKNPDAPLAPRALRRLPDAPDVAVFERDHRVYARQSVFVMRMPMASCESTADIVRTVVVPAFEHPERNLLLHMDELPNAKLWLDPHLNCELRPVWRNLDPRTADGPPVRYLSAAW